MIDIKVKRVAQAAFALASGGQLTGYENGEFMISSPWSAKELAIRFSASPERRFDDHVLRLRLFKRDLPRSL